MKRLICIFLLLAILLATPAHAAGAGTMYREDETPIAPGLTYYARTYGTTPQRSRTLELAPDSAVRPIIMACDTIWGGLTATECIAYAESLGYRVVAAVNGDFFNSAGVPIGLVVENGLPETGNVKENAFAILEDGSYYISNRPELTFTVENQTRGERVSLTRLNKKLGGQSVHLYTSDFSTVSTRVTDSVWAVRLEIIEGDLSIGGELTAEVTEVLKNTGAQPIGAGNLILTAKREGSNGDLHSRFRKGDVVTISAQCSDETLTRAQFAMGCGDILIENGAITDDTLWDEAIAGPNPRTLMGWKADGTLVMTVVDGRQESWSVGITLRQAAEELLRRGCVYAVNMDGGGSSTMSVRLPGLWEETVVNRPSAGGERDCGCWLLLVTQEAPDGVPAYLHLTENALLVAPGQQISLHAHATDRGLYPAGLTEPVTYTPAFGTVTGGIYTAPAAPGKDTIALTSGNASGLGSIRVVSGVTEADFTTAHGRTVTDLTLRAGQALELQVSAAYYGEPVLADMTALTYSWAGPIGRVNGEGRFVAGGFPGTTGQLMVQLGSYIHLINVTVAPGAGLPWPMSAVLQS